MKLIFFGSILFTAIVLSAGLAHLFSLPNKIHLTRQDYMVSQRAYDGWAFTGIAVIGSIILTLLLVIKMRRESSVFLPAIAAFICLVVSQVIFWWFTYPANRATNNWNFLPDNWIQLRKEWEYSHAIAAIFDLLAFLFLLLSVLNKKPVV